MQGKGAWKFSLYSLCFSALVCKEKFSRINFPENHWKLESSNWDFHFPFYKKQVGCFFKLSISWNKVRYVLKRCLLLKKYLRICNLAKISHFSFYSKNLKKNRFSRQDFFKRHQNIIIKGNFPKLNICWAHRFFWYLNRNSISSINATALHRRTNTSLLLSSSDSSFKLGSVNKRDRKRETEKKVNEENEVYRRWRENVGYESIFRILNEYKQESCLEKLFSVINGCGVIKRPS